MFTPIEYSITANQTFKRIKNGKDSIIIEAGRKSSEEVAQKFKLWTDGNIINNYNPKTLNFALTGVLTIKIHNTYLHTHRVAMFDHMVIAQGHIFLHNKWLLGGRNCIYSGKDPMSNQQYQLQCFDQQHRNWCFSLNSNNFNTFYIDRGKCN
ncbi:MAG: hypothetical protein OXD32_02285 [Endozoicomonadaceae bacterium]|nr:hypothetical protein [Endozoicomonadaceae bacterium]MCY4330890.1 hypothetical protein [Endozoicomonadaceae bacterium]